MTPMLVLLFGLTRYGDLERHRGEPVHEAGGGMGRPPAWTGQPQAGGRLCAGSVPGSVSGAGSARCPPTSTSICGSSVVRPRPDAGDHRVISRARSRREPAAAPWRGHRGVPKKPVVVLKPILVVLWGGCRVHGGLTSVGAGIDHRGRGWPTTHLCLQASALVGTDLVQAIPLVGGGCRPDAVRQLLVRRRVLAAVRGDPRCLVGAQARPAPPAASSRACSRCLLLCRCSSRWGSAMRSSCWPPWLRSGSAA